MRIFHTVVYEKKLKKLFQNEHVPIWHQRLKEARNSFFGLGVYLLKSKFRIEDKIRFP